MRKYVACIIFFVSVFEYGESFCQSFRLINGPRIYYFKSGDRISKGPSILVYSENNLLNNKDTLKIPKIKIVLNLKKKTTSLQLDTLQDLANTAIVLSEKENNGLIAYRAVKKNLKVDTLYRVSSGLVGSFSGDKQKIKSDCIFYYLYKIRK